MVGGNDLLIAAQAISLGFTLVTANKREFAKLQGLRCENWLGQVCSCIGDWRRGKLDRPGGGKVQQSAAQLGADRIPSPKRGTPKR